MRQRRFATIFAAPLVLLGCARCETAPASSGGVVIMSYNLQTLFDPVDQGGEYEDFRVSTGAWNDSLYRKRVEALASSILASGIPGSRGAGPDVIVVQEAENARVLRDLAEEAGGYPYVASSPEEDANLGCGILSRFPFVSLKAHRVRAPDDGPASVPRFMLEAELDADGRRLVVIAAHLKSKLGGAAETEPERRSAAAFASALVAARLASDPALAVIVAGDFNENPDEFDLVERAYPTALMPSGSGQGPWLLIAGDKGSAASEGGFPVLYCPWEEAGGYSYRYQGAEERIDQLLLSAGTVVGDDCPFRFEAFSAIPPEFVVDADGTPLGWNARTGSGYSDHLPIRIRLAFWP